MANYQTISEVQTYMDGRLGSDAWDLASNSDRTKAATMSTNIINQLNFRGEKTESTQVNEFPRDEDTTVPPNILKADSEIILKLLDGVDADQELENQALISQGMASMRATYDRSVSPPYILAGVPSVVAWKYLLPYLHDGQSITLSRV